MSHQGSSINVFNGNDLLVGGTGVDTLNGDNGDDALFGDNIELTRNASGYGITALEHAGDGNDSLNGGVGNDLQVGGLGKDSLDGAAGDDILFGDLAWFELNFFLAVQKLKSLKITSSYYLTNSLSNDVLLGGDGNDLLIGGEGVDSLDGGNGTRNLIIGGLLDSQQNWTGLVNLKGQLGTPDYSGIAPGTIPNLLSPDIILPYTKLKRGATDLDWYYRMYV